MPDYSDQYPDYWQRLRNAEKPVLTEEKPRVARVRISHVRPNDWYILNVWPTLSKEAKKKFYRDHGCAVPKAYRVTGDWGRVIRE